MKLLTTKTITSQLTNLNKKAQTEKVQEILMSLIIHAHVHANFDYLERTILKLKDIPNGNKAVSFMRKHSGLKFSKKGLSFDEGVRNKDLSIDDLDLPVWNDQVAKVSTPKTDEQKIEAHIKALINLGVDSATIIELASKLKEVSH